MFIDAWGDPARHLNDGRKLSVISISFGRARLCISPAHNELVYEDLW